MKVAGAAAVAGAGSLWLAPAEGGDVGVDDREKNRSAQPTNDDASETPSVLWHEGSTDDEQSSHKGEGPPHDLARPAVSAPTSGHHGRPA